MYFELLFRVDYSLKEFTTTLKEPYHILNASFEMGLAVFSDFDILRIQCFQNDVVASTEFATCVFIPMNRSEPALVEIAFLSMRGICVARWFASFSYAIASLEEGAIATMSRSTVMSMLRLRPRSFSRSAPPGESGS